MEELDTKKYAGIDLGKTSVQFSIYREGQEEMTEESFLLSEEEQKEFPNSKRAARGIYRDRNPSGGRVYEGKRISMV